MSHDGYTLEKCHRCQRQNENCRCWKPVGKNECVNFKKVESYMDKISKRNVFGTTLEEMKNARIQKKDLGSSD